MQTFIANGQKWTIETDGTVRSNKGWIFTRAQYRHMGTALRKAFEAARKR